MKQIYMFIWAMMVVMIITCACSNHYWNNEEIEIINSDGDLLRVLTIEDEQDSLFLRRQCKEIQPKALSEKTYSVLATKMIATVTSPEQDGVGIAGPQVGISRRIVAVQRFDKEGYPFEVYPNIRIVEHFGDPEPGPEGCLSVPGRRSEVLRYPEIEIRYTLPSEKGLPPRDTTERITGFTAVIFQHECDHLDGILYIDYHFTSAHRAIPSSLRSKGL